MDIETPRLLLRVGNADRLRAELAGGEGFALVLGASVPASWPPPLFDQGAVQWMLERVEADSYWITWGARYFLRKHTEGPAVAVGAGGFKGPPDATGTVELGYSIVPEQQRNGYASEAVEGMVAFAFTHPEVKRVIAETLPSLEPSIGVLQKTGFHLTQEDAGEGVIRFARLRPRS